jgi:hypothetical protein
MFKQIIRKMLALVFAVVLIAQLSSCALQNGKEVADLKKQLDELQQQNQSENASNETPVPSVVANDKEPISADILKEKVYMNNFTYEQMLSAAEATDIECIVSVFQNIGDSLNDGHNMALVHLNANNAALFAIRYDPNDTLNFRFNTNNNTYKLQGTYSNTYQYIAQNGNTNVVPMLDLDYAEPYSPPLHLSSEIVEIGETEGHKGVNISIKDIQFSSNQSKSYGYAMNPLEDGEQWLLLLSMLKIFQPKT